MKICVCIKQVPDVAAPIQVQGGALVFPAGRMVLNAYDASAVEEALVLTEQHGGEIDLVLVGPDASQETIRKALAMGATRATHLAVGEDAGLDARGYAEVLAAYLREHAYDVIACGKQAQDTDAGLTGGMLAALLDLPYATNAVGLAFDPDRSVLVVTRQGDVGREVIELPTPCLVTCSNDMNNPRIASLKGIMAAKRKPIDRSEAAAGSTPATEVVRYEALPAREPGVTIEGTPEEQVQDLVRRLQDEARVL